MRLKRLSKLLWMLPLFVSCSDSTSPGAVESPPIDRLLIFVRNWPTEYVELALTRDAAGVTLVLFHPPGDGQPRVVIDSIGPGATEPEEVRDLLAAFDVWALNAPFAPGAACKGEGDDRSCAITWNDYSVVMLVESGDDVRVQRYTRLDSTNSGSPARALGDFVLAWVRRLEGGA